MLARSMKTQPRMVAFLRDQPKLSMQQAMMFSNTATMVEKEAKLSEQYGQPIKLKAENDKEFIELASKNLERLQEQYVKTLDGAKAQLRDMLA